MEALRFGLKAQLPPIISLSTGMIESNNFKNDKGQKLGVAARNFKEEPRLQTDLDKLEKKVQNQREKFNANMLRVQCLENRRSVHRHEMKESHTDQEGQIVTTDHKFGDPLGGKSVC